MAITVKGRRQSDYCSECENCLKTECEKKDCDCDYGEDDEEEEETKTFELRYSRTEYGTITVDAADEEAARTLARDMEINWNDYGDTELDEVEEV